MKKTIITILLVTLVFGLCSCANNNSNQTNTATTNSAETTNTENQETETNTQNTNEPVEEVKKREPINIDETAAWLDTLPREERYAWYEERYGKYFTDYVSYAEDWTAKGYIGVDADMFVDTYVGMPCELFELLHATTVDDYMISAVSHSETRTSWIADW